MLDTKSYIFNSKEDAKRTVDTLVRRINAYGSASVADFKHYMGEGALNGDENVGWTDLTNYSISLGQFGWTISLPEPTKI